MTIVLHRDQGLLLDDGEQIGLECPYCGVYSHMSPESVPDVADLLQNKPKHVGLVYRCDACLAPVFLRFAVKQFSENQIVLYRNFIELERPKERFAFSYLPKHTEVLFREALRAGADPIRIVGDTSSAVSRMSLGLRGAHQLKNAAVALALLDELAHAGRIERSPEAWREGMSLAICRGRCEQSGRHRRRAGPWRPADRTDVRPPAGPVRGLG